MKKIPTLFERVFDGHKIVDVLPSITPGCEEAFRHGIATIKLDGSCCAIIDGQLYKRYDAKKNKTIPAGAIKCQDEPDPITGHLPCWIKCERGNPADKWFWAAYDFKCALLCVDFLSPGTYEAIGKHFQGNPYGLYGDRLEMHGERETVVDRTFGGVRAWLESHDHEGLVFWLHGEPVCKIKRSDFGLEWGRGR